MRRWFQQSTEGKGGSGAAPGRAKPVLGGRLACWRENWGRVESEARETGAVLRKGRGLGGSPPEPRGFWGQSRGHLGAGEGPNPAFP